MKKTSPTLYKTIASHAALGLVCVVAAFSAGLQTSGDVEPFEHSQAAVLGEVSSASFDAGDVDGNGSVTATDVMKILNHERGWETLSREEMLRADVNGDNAVDVKDALILLNTLSRS
jgi:hypothetical protein